MNRDDDGSKQWSLTPEQSKRLGFVPSGEIAGCETGTKIIVGKRCSGKTTDAIKESAATGRYILVPNRGMALNLANYAQELGLHIPFPITVREWQKGVAPNVKRRGVIIDEGLIMLEQLLGTHIHMITISEREEYKDIFTHEYLGKWVPGGGEFD